jgi:hypothetical protein
LPPFAFRSLTTPGKDRRSNSLLPFHAKDGRFSPTAHGDHSISARRASYFTLHRGSLGLRPVPACAAACCDLPCPLALKLDVSQAHVLLGGSRTASNPWPSTSILSSRMQAPPPSNTLPLITEACRAEMIFQLAICTARQLSWQASSPC